MELGLNRNHQNRVPTGNQEVSNFQKPGTEIYQEVQKLDKPVTETLPGTETKNLRPYISVYPGTSWLNQEFLVKTRKKARKFLVKLNEAK